MADANLEDKQHRRPKDLADGDVKVSFEQAFVKTRIHPLSCTAEGDGVQRQVEASHQANFIVQLRTRFGQKIFDRTGWTLVSATLKLVHEDPSQAAVINGDVVVDEEIGVYSVTYDGSRAGLYKMEVLVENAPVAGSPFVINIVAAKMDGTKTTWVGGAFKGTCAGKVAEAIVTGRDRYGNLRSGGSVQVFRTDGSNLDNCVVDDMGEGRYRVTYAAQTLSAHIPLSVLLDETNVLDGSPFDVFIFPADISTKLSFIQGRAIKRGGVRLPMKVQVHAVDSFKNHHVFGGINFHGNAVGPETFVVEYKDNKDGTYTAWFTTDRAGLYDVSIMFNGKHLTGSPFKTQVFGFGDAPAFVTLQSPLSGRRRK